MTPKWTTQQRDSEPGPKQAEEKQDLHTSLSGDRKIRDGALKDKLARKDSKLK
jgi:hypothetical protein